MTKPMFIDFWAPWCGYCISMKRIIKEIEEMYQDRMDFKEVNIDKEDTLLEKYRITGIPTYVIIDGRGAPLGRISGNRQKEEMISFVEECLGKGKG